MSAKEIVRKFYQSDAMTDKETLKEYLHPEIILEWNSSKEFLQMDYNALLDFSAELRRAYTRSNIKISHIIAEKNTVTVRYSHFANTIENPREEMLLAHFIAIWEIKDDKLFRGYQMSQL